MSVYLVTCEIIPSTTNPRGRFYKQIPLKSNHLYTNKKRDKYFVYKLFSYEKTAQKELARLFEIFDKQMLERNVKDKWIIVGGEPEPVKFSSQQECTKYLQKYIKRFYRYRVY